MATSGQLCLDCAALCRLCELLLARRYAQADRIRQLRAEVCDACADAGGCERFDAQACQA